MNNLIQKNQQNQKFYTFYFLTETSGIIYNPIKPSTLNI
jgi:hypothetical protein